MSKAEAMIDVRGNGHSFQLPVLAYQGSPSTLCKGCGHNSITSALIDACKTVGVDPYTAIKVSGIGCSSKTPAYFLQYSHGFNSLHGRMPSVATGAVLANHTLRAVGVSGDGDTANIGIGQFNHACRRNLPLVYLVENNGCYGLTKGQFSATAELNASLRREAGERNPVAPFDLCLAAITAGATFVARSFAGDRKQLVPLLEAALCHRGLAFLDVISPCVTFNDFPSSHKSWEWARAHEQPLQQLDFVPRLPEIEVEQVPGASSRVQLHDGSWITLRALRPDSHDVSRRSQAVALLLESQEKDEFLTGLIYLDTRRPDFVATQELVETPLVHLPDSDLRPGPEALEQFMSEWH
jgi:2-oxoglutarate ferredoxin oxidoreductase subunit beta